MARGRGGIRGRLDQLQANANRTMFSAQDLIAFAKVVLADVEDGFTIKLIRTGEGSVMDFVTGKIDELPIGVRIELEEKNL